MGIFKEFFNPTADASKSTGGPEKMRVETINTTDDLETLVAQGINLEARKEFLLEEAEKVETTEEERAILQQQISKIEAYLSEHSAQPEEMSEPKIAA